MRSMQQDGYGYARIQTDGLMMRMEYGCGMKRSPIMQETEERCLKHVEAMIGTGAWDDSTCIRRRAGASLPADAVYNR